MKPILELVGLQCKQLVVLENAVYMFLSIVHTFLYILPTGDDISKMEKEGEKKEEL
jgi:hypothetical protein